MLISNDGPMALPNHADVLALYGAVALPVFVLYVLVFLRLIERISSRTLTGGPLVSARDALVAALALDAAGFAQLLQTSLASSRPHAVMLLIVAVAAIAHLVALLVV